MSQSVSPARAEATGTRPEIQALRAVAVLAVVANHIWPEHLTGGFVGVDIFFVISGFLITSHLLKEIDRTGTVALAAFWARRARRLLPASLLVLLVTLGASMVLLPPTRWETVIHQVGASALYVQNWALAGGSIDYFASQQAASPVTHFWSLSVEEQFYIVWPLAMALALLALRRRPDLRRTVLASLMVLVVVASFAFAVRYTATHPNEAYFVTPARAWEFGLGGLLALAPVASTDDARRRVAASWLGWAALLASIVLFSEGTTIPGIPALLPVVGTGLVIWAGHARSALSPRVLVESVPVQFTGGISYSLYLWHWPLVVLTPYAIGAELTGESGFFLVAISMALAWITRELVEDPVRSWSRLPADVPRRSLLCGAAATVLVLAATVGCAGVLDQRTDAMQAQLEAAAHGERECFGAAAMVDPATCGAQPTSDVVPAPEIAAQDWGGAFDCYTQPTETEFPTCVAVPQDQPERRVALVGDSHAAMLSVALGEVAAARGWQLDLFLRSACPLTTADVFYEEQFIGNCADHRTRLLEELTAEGRYDTVVVTAWSGLLVDSEALPDSERVARLAAGYEAAWAEVEAAGPQVVVVADNPSVPPRLQECVSEAVDTAAADCVVPREEAVQADPLRQAAAASGAALVDLTDLYCDESGCPMVIGGVLVRFDAHHITATFARTLTAPLDSRLHEVLG